MNKTTHTNLLIVAAVIAMALPIVLVLSEKLSGQMAILDSISAYYHSGSRDIFVGSLFAVSVILFIYQGDSFKENLALDLAGLFGIITALVPTQNPGMSCGFACKGGITPYCIHTVAALGFFICLAYVSFFCFRRSCSSNLNQEISAKRYERLFMWIAILLLIFPLLSAVASTGWIGFLQQCSNLVFWLEFAAIYTVGALWITKFSETRHT